MGGAASSWSLIGVPLPAHAADEVEQILWWACWGRRRARSAALDEDVRIVELNSTDQAAKGKGD